jgi:hypothetical protein
LASELEAGGTARERDPADVTAAPGYGVDCGTLDDARLDLRHVGYCAYCDRLVVRAPDGSCPVEGHGSRALTGRMVLLGDEPVPVLPRFNLAAFLIPPLWGPAHGQWIGVAFLPIWLFMDSVIGVAGYGGNVTRVAAAIVVGLTLAFQVWFGRRGNGLAFRRVWDKMTLEAFVRRERVWAIVSVPVAVALVSWVFYFHLVLEATPSR